MSFMKSQQTLFSVQKTLERFEIVEMEQKYVERVLQICVESYFELSQFYKQLQLSKQVFLSHIKTVVEDTRIWPISFVVLDKENNNNPVAVKIVRDFAMIPQTPIQQSDVKLQFLTNLEYLMYKEELEKCHKWGNVGNNYLTAIKPGYTKFGIATLMSIFYVKQMYELGYKQDITAIFNSAAVRLNSKIMGQVMRIYDIKDTNIGGEMPFQNNNDGAALYVTSFSDQDVAKNISSEYVRNVKNFQKKQKQSQIANNSVLRIQPKL